MSPAWTPICLVPECDLDRCEWPMQIAVLHGDLSTDIPLHELIPKVVLAASFSEAGAALIARLPGLAVPHLHLTRDPAAAIARTLSKELGKAQYRIVRQLRELSDIRQMAERALNDFERLEAFVWASGRGERLLTQDLSPVENTPIVVAEQRLPGDSVGLSDVAIWTSGGEGRLIATLALIESGEVVGSWTIDSFEEGWLRLALPRALGSDVQTPVLRLEWLGEPLLVGRALHHPDTRFRCNGGPMLALRLWKFIPSSTAPLAPESRSSSTNRRRWLIGPAALAALSPDGFEPHEGAGLAARLTGPVTLRIPLTLHPDMRQVSAFISVGGSAVSVGFTGGKAVTITTSGQVTLFPEHDQSRDILLTLIPEAPATVIIDRIEAFANTGSRDD